MKQKREESARVWQQSQQKDMFKEGFDPEQQVYKCINVQDGNDDEVIGYLPPRKITFNHKGEYQLYQLSKHKNKYF